MSEKCPDWKKAWQEYALATDVDDKTENKQLAMLLTALGPAARKEVYRPFAWTVPADARKIDTVLEKFDQFCQPRENIPFERYKFNVRQQEPSELFEKYLFVLRQMSGRCNFKNLTKDDILRDRLLFGISDARVRKRLLREDKLALTKTLETCKAAEVSKAQIKAVNDLMPVASSSSKVHAVKLRKNKAARSQSLVQLLI